MQARAAKERAERLAQELRRRRGNREEVRAQLEREAEASVKLQLQQRDLEWRQKYQVGWHNSFSMQTHPQPHQDLASAHWQSLGLLGKCTSCQRLALRQCPDTVM